MLSLSRSCSIGRLSTTAGKLRQPSKPSVPVKVARRTQIQTAGSSCQSEPTTARIPTPSMRTITTGAHPKPLSPPVPRQRHLLRVTKKMNRPAQQGVKPNAFWHPTSWVSKTDSIEVPIPAQMSSSNTVPIHATRWCRDRPNARRTRVPSANRSAGRFEHGLVPLGDEQWTRSLDIPNFQSPPPKPRRSQPQS